METTIFVAGIPLRGASNICFEFSIKTLFFRYAGRGGICDEKVWSRVGVGPSKSIGCCWCSVPGDFVCDTFPPPGSQM